MNDQYPNRPRQNPGPALGQVRPNDPHAGMGVPTRRPAPAPQPGDFAGPKSIYRRGSAGQGQSRIVGAMVWIGVALISFVSFFATFLVIAPPTELIRDQLVAEVKRATGRDLIIAGGARLSLLPSLGMTLTDVALSSPPGSNAPPLFAAERLDISVSLLPMLLREVKVDRLMLQKPVLELTIDAGGKRSWDFAEAEPLRQPGVIRLAQATGTRRDDTKRLPAELQDFVKNSSKTTTPASGKAAALNSISLANVEVFNGTVRYTDKRTAVRHAIEQIDATLALADGAGQLDTQGKALYRGQQIAFDTRVASLKDALEEKSTTLASKLTGTSWSGSFAGTASLGASPQADGDLILNAASLPALASAIGLTLPGAGSTEPLHVSGRLKSTATGIAFADSTLKLPGLDAKGAISFDGLGGRPSIKATLKVATLDVDQLAGMMPDGPIALSAPPAAPPAAPPPAGPAAAGKAPTSIEDLLKDGGGTTQPAAKGPAVRGFSRRSDGEWSSETIEAAPLRLVDVDARLDIGQLRWRKITATQVQSTVGLKAGQLKFSVTDAQIQGGAAKALISVDARAPMLIVGANISADGVALRPLLTALEQDALIEGRGRVIWTTSGKGGSEREIVGSLEGRAEVAISDGAIVGWSVPEMVGGLSQGRLPNLARSSSASTPFSVLAATFQIASGVARTQDLRFESPSLKAGGTGVVNIVDRNIDFTLRPKIGGALAATGIEIPVRIAGPWNNPGASADINSALKSPQATEAAKQIGRQLKSGDVEGAARSVLGNDPKADEKIDKAKNLLRQFLKQ